MRLTGRVRHENSLKTPLKVNSTYKVRSSTRSSSLPSFRSLADLLSTLFTSLPFRFPARRAIHSSIQPSQGPSSSSSLPPLRLQDQSHETPNPTHLPPKTSRRPLRRGEEGYRSSPADPVASNGQDGSKEGEAGGEEGSLQEGAGCDWREEGGVRQAGEEEAAQDEECAGEERFDGEGRSEEAEEGLEEVELSFRSRFALGSLHSVFSRFHLFYGSSFLSRSCIFLSI